eukprot:3339811-Rhodomonas_salina.2
MSESVPDIPERKCRTCKGMLPEFPRQPALQIISQLSPHDWYNRAKSAPGILQDTCSTAQTSVAVAQRSVVRQLHKVLLVAPEPMSVPDLADRMRRSLPRKCARSSPFAASEAIQRASRRSESLFLRAANPVSVPGIAQQSADVATFWVQGREQQPDSLG